MNPKHFYQSNSPKEWEFVLKPAEYHYHMGFPGLTENIFRNAVYQNLYPFIPSNSTVLDCGCGWGAVGKMLSIDKQCKVTGVTNSNDQIDFIKRKQKEIDVIYADLNTFKPNKHYDTALFIESFSHIKNKANILKQISTQCDNVLFQIHTDITASGISNDNWHMYSIGLPKLIELLYDVGYRVKHCEDLECDPKISFDYWKSRLDILNPTSGQLKFLHDLSRQTEEQDKYTTLFLIHATKI